MKLNAKGGGDFTPHPETDNMVKGVVVDVTPPREQTGEFGTKTVFQIVVESEVTMENGDRFAVRSAPFGCSLHEKSSFRPFLKKMRGRDLTPAEEADFDTELLINLPVMMIIGHDKGKKDPNKVYAVFRYIGPDRSGEPLLPSGKYVRVKDRPEKPGGGGGGNYKRVEKTPEEEGRAEWQKCKVHVGKHEGCDLGDLDEESVRALINHWLPEARAKAKPLADDRRLMAALEAVKAELDKDGF